MTGHRSFGVLRKGKSPARRARNSAAGNDILREMALGELRQARDKAQVDLARALRVGQPAVAKLENRADMYVSNLRRYVEALGGTLEITARFPDGAVTIADVGEGDAAEK